MKHKLNFQNKINTVHTEAKVMPNQIEALRDTDDAVEKFIELEAKKYNKSDVIKDMNLRD